MSRLTGTPKHYYIFAKVVVKKDQCSVQWIVGVVTGFLLPTLRFSHYPYSGQSDCRTRDHESQRRCELFIPLDYWLQLASNDRRMCF